VVGDAFARPLITALDERRAAGRSADDVRLRRICSAGVAFSADSKRRLFEHLPDLTILDACGSTEGAHFGTCVLRAGDDLASATFVPFAGTIIVDEQRRPLPAGEVGFISSTTVTAGYHNHPDQTAEVFYFDDDGEWRVVPGDLGRIDADGMLTLLGRGSSVINTGGEKVHPEEVEDVIKTMPGIVDSIVSAIPDERFGSVVGAVVTRSPDADIDAHAVEDHVRARLAGYKAPHTIVFVDEIPRHANGKLDRARVAELLRDR
jgi:fatty-acyl-CoA synthase